MNEFLTYQNGYLHFGPRQQNLKDFASDRPTYVYDLEFIRQRYLHLQSPWPETEIHYAMKANPHPEILKTLQKAGAGVDTVSGGEIQRALENGFKPSQVVFSGIGKSKQEINYALDQKVQQINVESLGELQRIIELAKAKKTKATVAFRINPNVDIKTHPYIATGLHENKFGLEMTAWPEIQSLIKANSEVLNFVGFSMHLGSMMLELEGFKEALVKYKKFFQDVRKEGFQISRFDIGGGLGIFYRRQDLLGESKLLDQYVEAVKNEISGMDVQLQLEPGRWIVAHAGVLLSEVQYVKETPYKKFLILNTGMHHLIRPTLYEAYHEIMPLQQSAREKKTYDVVGPICESSDFFAKGREIPETQSGEFVVIADAGAYGASMASDYNLQPRPLEICF